MFQRIVTKFGLAAHLAMLAAIPCALTPFVPEQWLGDVTLWLALIAAIWVLLSPSIRVGEGVTQARLRVLGEILHDPVTWFFIVAGVVFWIAKANGAVELFYDAETTQWIVKKPPVEELPSSTPGAGYLPLAVTVSLGVCVEGICHALGRQARTWCILAASFIAGIGGFALVTLVFQGIAPFEGAALRDFGDAPFLGSMFIPWLFAAIAGGSQAEAEGWGASRLVYAVAVGGNVAAVAFLLPPVESAIILAVAAVFLLWSLFYSSRASGKGGAAARMLVMTVLGVLLAAFSMMLFAPDELRAAKSDQIFAAAPEREPIEDTFDDEEDPTSDEVFARIARQMWLQSPWCGVGIGAYKVQLPFFAEDTDWRILPVKAQWPQNSYWGILAERGITGCAILGAGLAFLLVFWAVRAVQAFFAVRQNDEHDIYPFAVQPISWGIIPILVLCALDARYSGILRFDAFAFAVAMPFAIALAAFPRLKKKKEEPK